MKIHHLNCATLCPVGRSLLGQGGGVTERGRMVAHCLLIEGNGGLTLVDTGFGTADVHDARRRLGGPFVRLVAPSLREEDTALRQVEALGFHARDVRDIVVTHLDLDHAGGLPDFPEARVHVHGPELDAALARKTFREKERYRTVHWAHGPRWERHTPGGDRWKGFESVRALAGEPEVRIIPLVGHSRGHSGVAVRDGERWLLHAGDAYFFHGEMDVSSPRCPPGLALFQSFVEVDRRARLANQERLRELKRAHGDVAVFSAHDVIEFDRHAARP